MLITELRRSIRKL